MFFFTSLTFCLFFIASRIPSPSLCATQCVSIVWATSSSAKLQPLEIDLTLLQLRLHQSQLDVFSIQNLKCSINACDYSCSITWFQFLNNMMGRPSSRKRMYTNSCFNTAESVLPSHVTEKNFAAFNLAQSSSLITWAVLSCKEQSLGNFMNSSSSLVSLC